MCVENKQTKNILVFKLSNYAFFLPNKVTQGLCKNINNLIMSNMCKNEWRHERGVTILYSLFVYSEKGGKILDFIT